MPGSIHKSREGEAEIQALYDEALDDIGLRYECRIVGTRGSRSWRLKHPSRFSGQIDPNSVRRTVAIDRDIPVRRPTLR
jgi:hypothetical protein